MHLRHGGRDYGRRWLNAMGQYREVPPFFLRVQWHADRAMQERKVARPALTAWPPR